MAEWISVEEQMPEGNNHKIYVPLISLYDYINHPLYNNFKFFIESRISNAGKKSNYKKFAKRMKKAIKYLPKELEVVVRVEKADMRGNNNDNRTEN